MQKNALGPQCFTCRKRQVKCDSTSPKCQRCKKDGLDCRGYKRPFTIITYSPTRKSKARSCSDTSKQDLSVIQRSRKQNIESPLSTEPDYLDLLESFRYYDSHVMPRSTPAHWPFKRVQIDRDTPWHMLPTVIQHSMILSLRSMFVSTQQQNARILCKDLQYYRGSSLSKLRDILQEADTDPHGIALACMILLMGADVSLCRFGSWTVHFDAAQRLISLRGGFRRTLNDLPQSRALLVRFMTSDVFTTSTCNSTSLKVQSSQSLEYVGLMDMDEDLMRQNCLCPFPIFQAIAQINALRTDMLCSAELINSVFAKVEALDISLWAQSQAMPRKPSKPIIEARRAIPSDSISCVADAARCFQLGALLYLWYSCGTTADFCKTSRIAGMYREELKILLRNFSQMAKEDHDAVLRSQIWKFVIWPLFISFYIRIGWHTSSARNYDQVLVEIDDIHAFASRFRSSALIAIASYLRSVLNARMQQEYWTWDDGFTSRCSFVL